MQLTIYHAAVDGPNTGTESHVFSTAAARDAWLQSIILDALEGASADQEDVEAIHEHLRDGDVSGAWDIFEEHLKDPLETYALEETEIDVPEIQAVVPISNANRTQATFTFRQDHHGCSIALPVMASVTADFYLDKHQTLIFDARWDDPSVTVRFNDDGSIAEIEVDQEVQHLIQASHNASPWIEARDAAFDNSRPS